MVRFLRIFATVVVALVALVVVLMVVLYSIGNKRLERMYAVTPPLSVVVPTETAVRRGEHLTYIAACRECHGQDLGGAVVVDFPLMKAVAPNLTAGAGGIGTAYSVADFDRAIRFGIGPDGKQLGLLMPSKGYHRMSDGDASALIAYLATAPAVDRVLEKTDIKPLYKVLLGLPGGDDPGNLLPDPLMASAVAPELGRSVEYGNYLATFLCRNCHGGDLRGKPHPDPMGPDAKDLGVVAAWTREGFFETMRTGVTPANQKLDGTYMPWPAFSRMTNTELDALYQYLKTVVLE